MNVNKQKAGKQDFLDMAWEWEPLAYYGTRLKNCRSECEFLRGLKEFPALAADFGVWEDDGRRPDDHHCLCAWQGRLYNVRYCI